jgi:hypothetical protein
VRPQSSRQCLTSSAPCHGCLPIAVSSLKEPCAARVRRRWLRTSSCSGATRAIKRKRQWRCAAKARAAAVLGVGREMEGRETHGAIKPTTVDEDFAFSVGVDALDLGHKVPPAATRLDRDLQTPEHSAHQPTWLGHHPGSLLPSRPPNIQGWSLCSVAPARTPPPTRARTCGHAVGCTTESPPACEGHMATKASTARRQKRRGAMHTVGVGPGRRKQHNAASQAVWLCVCVCVCVCVCCGDNARLGAPPCRQPRMAPSQE